MHYTTRAMEVTLHGWLLTSLTSTPSSAAFLGVFRVAPMFLLGIVIGSFVDRFSARITLALAQLLLALSSATLLVLILLQQIQVWHIYVALFASGAGYAGDFSARRALLSERVASRQLPRLTVVDTTGLTLGMLLGPIVGGWTIAAVGFAGALAVVLSLTGVAIVLVHAGKGRRTDVQNRRESTPVPLLRMVRELLRARAMRAVVLITIVMNTLSFPFQFLLPVVARTALRIGPVRYGLLSGAMGAAALLTTLFLTRVTPAAATRIFAFGSILQLGGVLLLGLSGSYGVSILAMAIAGIGFAGFASMQVAIAMRVVPQSWRGRSLGVVALAIGLQPAGAFGLGMLANTIGAAPAISVFGATGLVAVAVVTVRMELWRSLFDAPTTLPQTRG